MQTNLWETKLVALTMTSSFVLTMTGTFLQPEDLRIRMSSLRLSCSTLGGHMSILVTTTNTGTDSASARPRCSFVMPTMPALAPICDQRLDSMSRSSLKLNALPMCLVGAKTLKRKHRERAGRGARKRDTFGKIYVKHAKVKKRAR